MRKMNKATFIGFLMCFTAIIFGIASNGGIATIVNFIHIPSLLVTLGGSIFATMMTADSLADFWDGCKSFGAAFHTPKKQPQEVSEQILQLADVARREGLLALESHFFEQEQEQANFMDKGIRLVVDGAEPELVKDILETECNHREECYKRRVQFWQDLGAAAPAWGMVGTLLGLINMMRVMGTDASSIGAGMSLALITTLYGSVVANWICIPIARKLEKNGAQESMVMEVILEGVLSIQAGDHPRMIQEKIQAIFEDTQTE